MDCGRLTNNSTNYFLKIYIVYFDSNNECHDLTFNLGQAAMGATIPSRQFSIKVMNNQKFKRKKNYERLFTLNGRNSFKICDLYSKNFKILYTKVTNIECGSYNLAPQGCDQWFTGTQGTVMTFNYGNGIHLANQHQNICIR